MRAEESIDEDAVDDEKNDEDDRGSMSARNSIMDPVGAIRESMNWIASDAIPEEGEEEDEDGDEVRKSMMGNPEALLHPVQAMRDTMEWLASSTVDIKEEDEGDDDVNEGGKEEIAEVDVEGVADVVLEQEITTCSAQFRDKMRTLLKFIGVISVVATLGTPLLVMKLSGSSGPAAGTTGPSWRRSSSRSFSVFSRSSWRR